jgi:hypothetical protein
MKLRELSTDELSSIFSSLKIKGNERDIVKTNYFIEETNETEHYSFKKHFNEDNLRSDAMDDINLNISSKIKYYATTERDLNLELLAPELYQQFSELDKIVFFVGAGLSRLLEYPSWEDLADKAIEELRKNKIINYYTEERINNTIKDPLQKLSIFESYYKHDSDEYKKFYLEIFGKGIRDRKDNPYDLLVNREFNAAFITTNIDVEIINALRNKDSAVQISGPDDISVTPSLPKNYQIKLDINELKQDKVAMIHGRYDDPKKLIMSNFDYIQKYYREDNISRFLKDVFNQKTVIFIGYGLAELPILATIIDSEVKNQHQRENSNNEEGLNNHYLLLDSFENEKDLQHIYQNYFRNFNIKIIPYHLDEESYSRITTVLGSWRAALRSEKERFIEDTIFIDEFLRTGNHFDYVIKKIKQEGSQVLFNQFFKGIDKIEYFTRLKDEGFFEVQKIPKADNNSHPFYPPLFYLEKITAQVEKEENIEDPILLDVLKIIKDVSKDYEENNFKNLNRNTIWYFILIISNLPNSLLTKDFIESVILVWIENLNYSDSNLESIMSGIFPKLCTIEDITKAELILKSHLQKTYDLKDENIKEDEELRYFIRENVKIKVFLENCSSDFIISLADLINYLRVRNYPIEFEFEKDNPEYHYKAKLTSNKTFEFCLTDIPSEIEINRGKIFFNCYADEKEIKEKVIDSINKYFSGDDTIINLHYFLHWGIHNNGWNDEIFDDDMDYRKDLIDQLSNFLKQILITKAKCNPQEIVLLIQRFFDVDFSIPFFKQLTLPVIETNFSDFSQFFLDTILNEKLWNSDLNFGLDKDVKTFLRRNQKQLKNEHVEKLNLILHNIDNKYTPSEEGYQRKIDFEKLEWLEALKENSSFKQQYDRLNAEYHLEPDYFSSMGDIKYYSGEVSPFSVDELLLLNVSELYSVIINFKQIDRFNFNGGSIRGLTNAVCKIAELNPKKILELIEYNQTIPVPYMNGIIEGFKILFKNSENKVEFNEKKLFELILHYIESFEFKNNKLIIEEYYSDYQKEWFISETAQLIEEYLKNKTKKVDSEEPVRLILQSISTHLNELNGDSYIEKDGNQFRDYNLRYVINSSKGKVLLALYVFAWYKKTTLSESSIEPLVKQVFIDALTRKIRDAYIIFGTYLAQFEFIEKEFTIEWIKKIQEANDEEWKCFFGGWLFFKMQYCSKGLYVSLIPHFKRAFDLKFYSEDLHNSGLVRSVLIAYYWNYEEITGEIFQKMLNESSVENLSKLLVYAFSDFQEFQKQDMLDSYKVKIFDLWKELKTRFETVNDDGIEKVRFNLFELIRYWDKIDPELYELLLYSITNFKTGIQVRDLIEEFNRLFEAGKDNAIHISQLILKLSEKGYCPFSEGKHGGEIYDLLDKLALIKNDTIRENIKDACMKLIKNSNGLQKRGRDILTKLGKE